MPAQLHREVESPPVNKANRRTFVAGQELVREGDKGDEAYLIISGRVEVVKGANTYSPTKVAELGGGEVIGELALIDARERTATVVAKEDTVVSVLSREEFEKRSADLDPLLRAVYGVTVKRLRYVLEHGRGLNTFGSFSALRT